MKIIWYNIIVKRINVSIKQIDKYAGMWVVIDPVKDRIIAASESLKEIGPMVTHKEDETEPVGRAPYSFLVPQKDEGPYQVLTPFPDYLLSG